MTRHEVSFDSGHERCAGWWYVPDGAGRKPFVVMGHGMGATRELGLDAYARRFCAAGLCVLVFDYRHYGSSGGQPRELLSIARQLADYRAAVAYAKQRPEVDPEQGALWGVSFSGGHVMALSAESLGIRAVVAQVPFSSGSSARRTMSREYSKRVARLALSDVLSAVLGRDPVYVPLFGPADAIALMANDECAQDYPRIVPPDVEQAGRWRNRIAARVALTLPFYEPGRNLAKAGPPVLLIVGELDTLTPAAFTLAAAARSKRVEVLRYPGRHFDYCDGPGLERAVTDALAFLRKHLGLLDVAQAQPVERAAGE